MPQKTEDLKAGTGGILRQSVVLSTAQSFPQEPGRLSQLSETQRDGPCLLCELQGIASTGAFAVPLPEEAHNA